jgi:hypothetical protein
MKSFIVFISLFFSSILWSVESTSQSLNSKRAPVGQLALKSKTLVLDADSFYDPAVDYSSFSGRVTDRDATAAIVKVSSESKNVRFFRAGDLVQFKVQSQKDSDYCDGYVRSIEENYFVMFTKDLEPCFPQEDYFRRGTALIMRSTKLGQRIREASVYRASLIQKKKDFMQQLNGINNGLWNFEERKVQLAAEYDQRLAELEKEKLKALENLLSRKNDEIKLQRELVYRLDTIDQELDFYRIDKNELMIDRWHLDKDLGYPVYNRPEEIRPKRASGESHIE